MFAGIFQPQQILGGNVLTCCLGDLQGAGVSKTNTILLKVLLYVKFVKSIFTIDRLNLRIDEKISK